MRVVVMVYRGLSLRISVRFIVREGRRVTRLGGALGSVCSVSTDAVPVRVCAAAV